MSPVRNLRRRAGLTQKELAALAGTSQSTIAAYEAGNKSPTLRTLENLASSVNLAVAVSYVPQMTREDRRSLAFHKAIVLRFEKDPQRIIAKAKSNLEKLIALHPSAFSLLETWQDWLRLSQSGLTEKLLGLDPLAREMRHVSPFSGILSAEERTSILKKFQEREAT